MEKNVISDNRQVMIDEVNLDAILQGGPSALQSEVASQIPPPPQAPVQPAPVAVEAPVPDEGPDEKVKSQMVLPSEQEKAALKAKYGMLRVVPIPYMLEDQKIQTYVLRRLTRSQWRATEETSAKIAEAKPGVAAEEIFQERIVATAVVWPNLPEHEIALSPPGLVPTLFGIIQQMGCFFNPEAIMGLTFTL